MALSPMLVIGCGGSGGKVLASLRKRLLQELDLLGWHEGIPRAWQLVYIDTPSAQEVNYEFGPPIPDADYIPTGLNMGVYANVDEALTTHANEQGSLGRLVDWRPSPDLLLAVDFGAGQWRGVGRAVGFHGLNKVADRIERSMGEFVSGQAQLQRLGERLGDSTPPSAKPFVIVVSSLAGGTGAGIFMDVCDIVRNVDPSLTDQLMAVLFTAEVFRNIGQAPGLQPNTVASLAELMAGYFDRNREQEPLYRGLVQAPSRVVGASGPSYPFLVGMSTVNGTQLADVGDCYRVVTETLLAAMTRPTVYEDLLAYQVGNWGVRSGKQTTLWKFGQGVLADGSPIAGGMVSSFGSSRLCVGSMLFGEYAVARLTREVLEFVTTGYVDLGRELIRDPLATADEVLAYYRNTRGMAFVEACNLRELDQPDGSEYNQVLESIVAHDDLARLTGAWTEELRVELGKLGAKPKAKWMEAMQTALPMRRSGFLERVRSQIDAGAADFVATVPERVTREVSRVMFELGVPVARELVRVLKEHVDSAAQQLGDQARAAREGTGRWVSVAMGRMSNLNDNDAVTVDDARIIGTRNSPGALRTAVLAYGWEEARAMRMERAIELLRDLSRDVLGPLVASLDQVMGKLSTEGPDQWKRLPDGSGIPQAYRPTPFDFCLIGVDRWPELYTRLCRETAGRETATNQATESGTLRVAETVRRLVGGGGFDVIERGALRTVQAALTAGPWERGRPVRFQSALDTSDVFERARTWTGRESTPFHDFITQDLRTYLLPEGPDGQAIADHQQRLNRFKDLLTNAIASATPLVSIDKRLLSKVHPDSKGMHADPTQLTIEPLPVTGDARRIAQEVLDQKLGAAATNPDGSTATSHFVEGTSQTPIESVLIVSQLKGAVHPSVMTSVTQPIAEAWNSVRASGIDTFWQYRRARTLPESIPVSPKVLNCMIKGWFTARMLGAIPDPDDKGFRIGYDTYTAEGVKTARFVWPLLRSGALGPALVRPTHKAEWLPALLESLGLAYALYPTDPGALDGYDALYGYGASIIAIEDFVTTGSIPAGIAPAQITGDTPHARYESALDGLDKTLAGYRKAEQQSILPGRKEFFSLPYGFSLYPLIVEALEELRNALPNPVDAELGAVG